MNPIKIKLITKGKNTHTHTQIEAEKLVVRGWREIVVQRARVQMEKKKTREI